MGKEKAKAKVKEKVKVKAKVELKPKVKVKLLPKVKVKPLPMVKVMINPRKTSQPVKSKLLLPNQLKLRKKPPSQLPKKPSQPPKLRNEEYRLLLSIGKFL